MPISTAMTLPAGEVAFILRKKLGPLRSWSDFLADCIRAKTSIQGLVLMPCARVRSGGSLRPVYDARDILVFVNAVRALSLASPVLTGGIVTHTVEIDSTDRRHWKLRILVPRARYRRPAISAGFALNSLHNSTQKRAL